MIEALNDEIFILLISGVIGACVGGIAVVVCRGLVSVVHTLLFNKNN